MTKLVALGAAIGTISALAAVGCGGDEGADGSAGGALAEQKEYVVGYAAGRTGFLGVFEEPVIKGLQQRVETINAAGGIGGKSKIRLMVEDTRSDPANAAVVAKDLLNKGAQLLISPCDADAALPAAQAAQQASIPTISSCAASATMPQEVGDYAFLNITATDDIGAAEGNFASDQGWKTACVFGSEDIEYTSSISEAAEKAFAAGGGRVVCKPQYKVDGTTFTAQATEIARANPDVVLTPIFLPQALTFFRNLRAAGYDGPVISSDGIEGKETLAGGPAVKEVYTVTHAFPSDDAAGRLTAEFYEELGYTPPSMNEALGGDLASVIAAAVDKAGSTEPTKVRDAIAQLEDVEGTSGPITYAGRDCRVPAKQMVILRANPDEQKFEFVSRIMPKPTC